MHFAHPAGPFATTGGRDEDLVGRQGVEHGIARWHGKGLVVVDDQGAPVAGAVVSALNEEEFLVMLV